MSPTSPVDTAPSATCPRLDVPEVNQGWTQLAGNAQRTSYASHAAPPPWTIRWIWNGPTANGDPAPGHLPLPKAVQPVVGGGRLYVGHADGIVRAISVETGELLWESPNLENAVVNTAAFDQASQSLYVGTTSRFWRLRADTGEVVRSNRPGGQILMAPLVVGDLVFVGSTSGAFYAFDKETLELHWLYDAQASLAASPAYSRHEGGLIILLAEDGSVHAVCAANGAQRWRTVVNGDMDELRGGVRFPDTFPVVAEASGVVLIRSYLDWSKMWLPEGGAPEGPEAMREFLAANPEHQSFFVLNLTDGRPRFIAPVLIGAIGNGGDFESTPPQAVVRALADGSEVAYLLWRTRHACPASYCDGREDTTLGELDLVSGSIRFVQDHKNTGGFRVPTDEQSPLSMAGDVLLHAHWMLLEGVQLVDRSPALGLSYGLPIQTRPLPPVLNTLRHDICSDAPGRACSAVMQTPCDNYTMAPGLFVYHTDRCIYDEFWTTPVRSAVIDEDWLFWRTVDGAIVAIGPQR